jgi:hypothetical protein
MTQAPQLEFPYARLQNHHAEGKVGDGIFRTRAARGPAKDDQPRSRELFLRGATPSGPFCRRPVRAGSTVRQREKQEWRAAITRFGYVSVQTEATWRNFAGSQLRRNTLLDARTWPTLE